MIPHCMIVQSTYKDAGLSRRRLNIAEHTSVASLRYQSQKPIVHLTVDIEDPLMDERILLFNSTGCEVKVLIRDGWKLYKENWELPEGRKIVSRMDDDDAIFWKYCEETRNAAPESGEMVLLWQHGFVMWREQVFALRHRGIQFVTLVTDKMTDPHQEPHWLYHQRWATRNVSYQPGWIWIRHGDSATSTLQRYRKNRVDGVDSTRFPLDFDAINEELSASGIPSANYTEHANQATLQSVLRENRKHSYA